LGKKCVVAVACLAIVTACSGADQDDTGGLPRFSAPPSAAAPSERPVSEPSDVEQIVEVYHAYTSAVSQALATGDGDLPELRATATGQALKDARERVRANRENGVLTTGELEPSATTAEVDWSGGDQAAISDCVLNGLNHVEVDRPEIIAAEADGTRRPVEAELMRTSDGWMVSRVEMPQDEDANNPQEDPPFLRGPMPDGPPSCAPPELEQELLARYQAFWDAFDRAFGFGRSGPANPDDPALAETQVDPQLSDTRRFLINENAANRAIRGSRNSHDHWVLAVADFDTRAFVADCVILADNKTIDLDTDETHIQNNTGQLNYYESEMVKAGDVWKVRSWNVRREGIRRCESP
jgi:hypothetical protein